LAQSGRGVLSIMENVKISLITTLFNEADNINAFLESYQKQTKYADEFIIVDGGSTDGTAEIIRSFVNAHPQLNIWLIIDSTCNKKHVNGPIAKGRNVAIQHARYDYIAVTDAGCILERRWFEEISRLFADHHVDVVSGWYEALIENDFQKEYSDIYLPKLATVDLNTFLPSSRSIAFKKNCWEKVSGYPETSLTGEDTKFDMDMKKLHCKFVFNPNAIVYWECPKNDKEAFAKATYYAIGDGKFKLHLRKFLLRNLFLLCPFNILLSKKRRKNFSLSYGMMFHYQKGYIKGLLS